MQEIQTRRLLLRTFRESDYDDLFEFLSQLADDEKQWTICGKTYRILKSSRSQGVAAYELGITVAVMSRRLTDRLHLEEPDLHAE